MSSDTIIDAFLLNLISIGRKYKINVNLYALSMFKLANTGVPNANV